MLKLLKVVRVQRLFGDRHLARDAFLRNRLATTSDVEQVHGTVGNLDRWQLNPTLWLDSLPVYCRVHEVDSAERAVAVLVAVWSAESRLFPIRIIRVDLDSSAYAEMLEVAPAQVRTGEYDERNAELKVVVSCTYRAWSASAKTPAAFGAAAEVPPCPCAHLFFPTSVVTWSML